MDFARRTPIARASGVDAGFFVRSPTNSDSGDRRERQPHTCRYSKGRHPKLAPGTSRGALVCGNTTQTSRKQKYRSPLSVHEEIRHG